MSSTPNAAAPALPRWAYGWIAFGLFAAQVYLLRGLLPPVLFAFAVAYLLDPLVDRLEARGVPRSLGILVLLSAAGLLVALASVVLVPMIVNDLAVLAAELPVAIAHALSAIEPMLLERGIELPHSSSEALEAFEHNIRSLAPNAAGLVRSILGTVVGGTASVFGALAAVVVVPVLAFYLLKDFDMIAATTLELVPIRRREAVASLAREVDQMLGQFLRGQLTVMAILASLYAAGYSLVGVSLAVPVGVIGGLLSFIPYVGSGVALGLGVLMVVLHWTGWSQLIGVLVVYAVVQTLEGLLITPRIVGEKLGLSPVWVLLALMAGAELYGFLGVMLALPAAAVCKVFAMHALNRYRSSRLFAERASVVPDSPLLHRRRSRRMRRSRGKVRSWT